VQEINQEIKNTTLDHAKALQDMTKVFFSDIFPQTRYRHSSGRDFDFNRRFDSHTLGVVQHALTLQVYVESISEMGARLKATNGVLVVRLPEDGPNFNEPFEYAVKVATYLNRKSSVNLTKTQQRRRQESMDFPYPGSTEIMRLEGTVDDLLSRKDDEQLVNGRLIWRTSWKIGLNNWMT